MIISVQFHKVLKNNSIEFCGKTYDYETNSKVCKGDIIRMWQGSKPVCNATRVKIIDIKKDTRRPVIKVECVREENE